MVFIFDCNFRYLYGVLGNIKHRPPCNITCEKSYIAGSEKTLDRADSPSKETARLVEVRIISSLMNIFQPDQEAHCNS